MPFGIEDEIRHIQNAARRRDAAEQAMDQERSLVLVLACLNLFGPAVFEAFVAGPGFGLWALILTIIIPLARSVLDFILRLFGVSYGFGVHAALFLVPIGVLFTLPVLFGAGAESGLSFVKILLAAFGYPAIIFAALYLRQEVSPLDDYMAKLQRRG